MKKIALFLLVTALFVRCNVDNSVQKKAEMKISKAQIEEVTKKLTSKFGDSNSFRVKRGVNQVASLWRADNGDIAEFTAFCEKQFVSDPAKLKALYLRLERNFEIIYGHNNKVSLDLLAPIHLNTFESTPVDNIFGAYSPGAHLADDLYKNKIAFIVALNYPSYSLKEKTEKGPKWSRLDWAYARMGDMFTSRVPADLKMAYSTAETNADIYIADYNIYVGELLNDKGEKLFPKGMKLLSHWNLRDEIKSNYANDKNGLEKQKMIYQVMKRIISQEIPEKVINNDKYQWNPFSNKVFQNGSDVSFTHEPDKRYAQIINCFRALKAMDEYSSLDTYIKRKFEGEMEIAQPDVEKLFDKFLSSDVTVKVAALIKKRLGRDLQPFDIWYDGFKARSSIDANKLNKITQTRYPNPKALEKDIESILLKLDWKSERAKYIASKIAVDPARGSGHAWGAGMKGSKSHLRTRIAPTGMDYKGYNIAIHELGHNVEQTVSLYDVDYFMLNGVPNTSFTEALAFIFQKRDLDLLNMKDNNPKKEYLQTLDNFWSVYEIMGVSMVDMKVWKWLYANPNATPAELKVAVQNIAKEVWNKYYAKAFGIKDQPILGIYSHMIASPLYLTAYSFGHLIDFQLEQHLKGKDFSDEVDRIFTQGRLIPNVWMQKATGENVSIDPIVKATEEAVGKL